MAGQGENPHTPRMGRMLGLGGSHPLQTPPSQATPGSSRSLGSSWVELTPEPNAQLVGLSESTPDPVSNLNDHLPASPAVLLAEFVEECTELIEGVNPRLHPSPERRSIRLPKCQLLATPSQLFQAWRMLNQREMTGLRGGLQASQAGTGKSFVCLTALILRCRMFQLARETKHFWSLPAPKSSTRRARPAAGTHLPSTAHGNGLSCPSQAKGDVICYCVPTSRARAFIDAGVAPRGCAIVQAPFSVVPQWISILASANLDPAAYNLIISYNDVPIRLKRNFAQVVKSLQPGAPTLNQAPETYIFVSSHTNERVFDTFTGPNAPIVGIQLSDESHFAMKSPAMGIAEAQSRTGDGLDLWLVSATPIKLLEDFELPMQIFSSSSHLARVAAMKELVTAHAAAVSSDVARQRFLRLWSQVFDNALVIRNTITSQFNGRPITALRVTKAVRVLLDTPQQHLPDVQEVAYLARDVVREKAKVAVENGEAFTPDYDSSVDGRLHFVSLFPGAAGLIHRKELDISLDNVRRLIAGMKVPNKLKVENICIFQRHLEEVSRGSPKLDFIMAEVGRMRADKEQRPPLTASTDLHGENLSLKKMVIITPTLATSVFLYLFILKRMPQLNPVCFHTTGSSTADREAALQSFQSLTARKTARHSYVFITPFSVGGTGLNLQSANYQIFASPPSSKEAETQGFARTNRTGQRLPLHHSILIMQDSPADKFCIASYGGRLVVGDPFDDIKRNLVLAAPGGSKAISRLSDWGYKVANYEIFFELVKDVYPTIEEEQCHGREISHRGALVDYLDRFVYFDAGSVAGSVLGISEACNKFDPRPRHEILALRDMYLSIWVHELDRPPRSLKCFLYFTVVERVLNERLRPEIYRSLGKRLIQRLFIHRDSKRREEREAFANLREYAPFCIGVRKMLDEYSEFAGVEIVSFEFLPNVDPDFATPEPSFDFRIVIS